MRKFILFFIFLFTANVFALPTPEFVPGQLIVKYRSSSSSMSGLNGVQSVLGKYNAKVLNSYSLNSNKLSGASTCSSFGSEMTSLVNFDKSVNLNEVKSDLSKVSEVISVEPNYYVFINAEPQISGSTALPQVVIDGDSYDVNEIVVAVVDTGVDYNNSNISSKIWQNSDEIAGNGIDDDNNGYIDDVKGFDFYNYAYGSGDSDPMDDHNHGTHVSGIVLGYANSQVGLTNINSNIKVMPVRFLNSEGSGNQYDAATAIRYAVDNGARIINCSWGYFIGTSVLQDAVNYAIANNVFIVASAGNNNWSNYQYPASYSGVISVSAVDNFNRKAAFSNYGDYINLCAPGVSILSTAIGNSTAYMSGTSQSTPFIAQKMAYLLGISEKKDFSTIYNAVNSYTIDIVDPLNNGSNLSGWDQYTGFGQMDHSSAASYVVPGGLSETNSSVVNLEKVFNYPNPAKTSTTFGFYLKGSNSEVSIDIYDLFGNLVRSYEQNIASNDTVYNKTMSWDLKDDSGEDVSNGSYIYVVTADSGGNKIIKKQKAVVLR